MNCIFCHEYQHHLPGCINSEEENPSWEYALQIALELMLKDTQISGPNDITEHLKHTPGRVIKAYKEFFRGANIKAEEVLNTIFTDKTYDEVIIVSNITFTSFCAHHLLPFRGQVHFGYMPDKHIVGLSKIPRLVEALSRRLQVQESLSTQIVDIFHKKVKPLGCGVVIEAEHSCMSVRGIEQKGAITETTALAGNFKVATIKSEFLSQISPRKGRISL